MARARPYEPGDRVKVLVPKLVERVGYNLRWDMIVDEVRKSPNTLEAYYATMGLDMPEIEGFHDTQFAQKQADMIPFYFVQACAKMEVERRGFGGPERKLHYYGPKDPKEIGWQPWINEGQIMTVRSKRTVITGKRIPGFTSYSGEYGDEKEWVCAYLENRKSHVLLTTDEGEIEACNVELVWKAGTA